MDTITNDAQPDIPAFIAVLNPADGAAGTVESLANYPAMPLWSELRAALPLDGAIQAYEAAAANYRASRN